jgi:hypothetical protein
MGGKARAKKLSKKRLSEIGKMGGRARNSLHKIAIPTRNPYLLAGFLLHETITSDG